MLPSQTCTEPLSKLTQDAIAAGTAATGGEYIAAIKGAMTLVDDLAYPRCPQPGGRAGRNLMNDSLYGESLLYLPDPGSEGDFGYYTYYDATGHIALGNKYFDLYNRLYGDDLDYAYVFGYDHAGVDEHQFGYTDPYYGHQAYEFLQ